jgi:peroxiredoxin
VSEQETLEVPQTLEGWYVLHDIWSVDWSGLGSLAESERGAIVTEASEWLAGAGAVERGDSAAYSVLTQKGDLMFVHYRETPDDLNRVELGLRQLALYDFLIPAYSYFSVVEVSLYEVQAMAMRRLADRGLERGTPDWEAAFSEEMEKQKKRMDDRLWMDVPPHRYCCFYPMSKKRGESVNWYALPLAERRKMMRNHGSIGHKYAEVVKQVISGSTGLDDWEWGVDLHSEDALVFKKLVYEMRFDAASALYAEFGPFYIGMRVEAPALGALLQGELA